MLYTCISFHVQHVHVYVHVHVHVSADASVQVKVKWMVQVNYTMYNVHVQCIQGTACSLSPIKVDDEVDGLEEDSVLGVGVLDLLALGGLLGSI